MIFTFLSGKLLYFFLGLCDYSDKFTKMFCRSCNSFELPIKNKAFQCILLRQAVTSVRRSKKRFVSQHRKTSTLPVRLGYARCISKLIVLPVCSPCKGNRKTNKVRISSNHLEGNLGFYKRTKSKVSELVPCTCK